MKVGPTADVDNTTAVHQAPYAVPAHATEILLIRHGASLPARAGAPFALLEGRGDPQLSPTGIAQAEAVTRRLRKVPLSAIYVTTLRRTAETARPLAAARGLGMVAVPELVEVHLGEMEGGEYQLRAARGDATIRRAFREQRWDAIPGAEPNEAVAARVCAGVERIVSEVGMGTTVVVFTHGGTIGEVCSQATGCGPLALSHADNCSITRVVAHPSGRLFLRSHNDICHL